MFYVCKIHKGPISIIFNEDQYKIERSIHSGTLKECKAFCEENYGLKMTLGAMKKALYTTGILKVQ